MRPVTGVLAVWNDVIQENEAEFNEWYIREHIPERVGVPGFCNGRRHMALSSADPSCPRNFTFYEVESPDVLTSAAYVARLNAPTVWTQRTMPWFTNMSRTACEVKSTSGQGHGAFAGTMQLTMTPGREEDLTSLLAGEVLPNLTEQSGIVSAQYWQGDPAQTNVSSTERGLRRGEDASVNAAVMVSATHAGALANAAIVLSEKALGSAGAAPATALHLYQLVYELHHDGS